MITKNFNNETQTTQAIIRSLYSSLEIIKPEQELGIASAPSEGVAASRHISQQDIPPNGEIGIFIAKKIPNKLLGDLDRVSGIITLREDKSSHAAIICRAAGIPIVNVTEEGYAKVLAGVESMGPDSSLAIDTFANRLVFGDLKIHNQHIDAARREALALIERSSPLSVHANSDTAHELRRSVSLGFKHAWPRSETLLYDRDTLAYFLAFLLEPHNQLASEKFIEGHTNCVLALFNEAKGTRVAFRLLDPPSHEFLPEPDDLPAVKRIADILGKNEQDVANQIKLHRETNPMIGHRGARLLLTNVNLLHAQAVSMLSAWKLADADKRPPAVEMLVPFVMHPAEMRAIKKHVQSLKDADPEFVGIPMKYGCMVELPSLLDYAAELAPDVDFVSFGTNDLVATSHGIARGDAYERYLKQYIDNGLIEVDPFSVLPPNIVKKIRDFCLEIKEINPAIRTDICGEQAINTDLSELINSGALNSVSIGTENLPILLKTLLNTGQIEVSAADQLDHAPACKQGLAPS